MKLARKKKPQHINWRKVEGILGTDEGGHAEEIVHECAHHILCTGTLGFVGNQNENRVLIDDTFGDTESYAWTHEVEASLVTYLTLLILGEGFDEQKDIIKTMTMNTPKSIPDAVKLSYYKQAKELGTFRSVAKKLASSLVEISVWEEGPIS